MNPLASLKVYLFYPFPFFSPKPFSQDSQERTRKRIKEDIKDSGVAYGDYAENMLPKLKRSYLKKCQDVEVRLTLDFVFHISLTRVHPGLQSRTTFSNPLFVSAIRFFLFRSDRQYSC
jgi:hypothetical protein